MRKIIQYLTGALIFAILISLISCSEVGANIETVDRVSDGVITAYIDQTEFTKEETDSICVHFEVGNTVAEGGQLIYGAPSLEKYTRDGWSGEDYVSRSISLQQIKSAEGVFEYEFNFSEASAEPDPGVYRLTFAFRINGHDPDYVGTFQLVFRVI